MGQGRALVAAQGARAPVDLPARRARRSFARHRRLFRAFLLGEELRLLYHLDAADRRPSTAAWLRWASRSKLRPFVKLARTIRAYRPSIEATIEWRVTNGIAESVNSCIGRLRTNARGFHDPQAFITMIMLDRAGIGPHLPWAS